MRRFLAVLCATALVLAGAEAFLRLKTTYVVSRGGAALEQNAGLLVRFTPRGKRLVPDAHVVIRNHYLSNKDVLMDVNSLGFRDAELRREKAPGELRVLVLGDSITWADYLQADEVYVERAERRLRAELPGRRVEVVNAGVGDTGLREQIDLLVEVGLSVRPDVIVVAFYLNDSRPPWGFPAEVGHPGWLRRHSVLADAVYRAAKLRRWMRRQGEERFAWTQAHPRMDWKNDRAAFERLARLARYDWGAAWQESSWTPVAQDLDRLEALSGQHAFGVAIVSFPVSFQVYARFLDDAPQRRLRELALARGFAFLDLLPLLRSHAGEDLFFDHCHPRERTNARIGDELAGFLLASFGWR